MYGICQFCRKSLFQIDLNGQGHIRIGKLNLVDLAGSERLRKSHSGVSILLFWSSVLLE